jgi:hypothetical protein
MVAPISSPLAIRTVFGHVTSISADSADNAGSEVPLLRTIIFAMSDLTAILTSLIFIITKSTVKGCKLSELVSFEFILDLWDRSRSLDDVVDQLLGLDDLFFRICHD